MRIDRKLVSKPPKFRPPRRLNLSFGSFRFWLSIAALGILGALVLLLAQILLFARTLDRLPAGLMAGGVPVGGLAREEAAQRLRNVYATPLTLDYRGSAFQLDPKTINFEVDAESMLDRVPIGESSGSVWTDLWAYLWGTTPPAPDPIPLQAEYDHSLLQSFLADVAARYDEAGTPPRPDPDTLGFVAGSGGFALDQTAATELINTALRSPDSRAVSLPVADYARRPPTYGTLAELLYTNVRLFQFTGTVSIFLQDLNSGDVINMAVHNGQWAEVGEGIAYSGMSTIKIPVMVTFFRYKDTEPSPDERLLLDGVFAESANTYTDLLLGIIGDGSGLIGANLVSDTMQEIGLPNTYLAGLLDTLGAITSPRNTPGNTRTDIDLDPDPFNQTAAPDMGRLMAMIYECSRGGGALLQTFGEQFTAAECKLMIDLLLENEVGPIFVAGGTPGATVAHKHGWDLLPLNNLGDVALVYGPNHEYAYAVAIFVHRAEPVLFDDANRLIISLATAITNFYAFR